ncbi:MAG: HAD family hydrolase [Spirochaetota bacterium]|nr:HAD family hydrolase [Spirochaetota bacterium]
MANLFSDLDTIIFDNDGTLFQADLVSFPAVVSSFKDLMKFHSLKIPIPSKDTINSNIGLPARDYFMGLLPEPLRHLTDEFCDLCVQHEITNIQKGLGSLYPGVEETLRDLKARGYNLGVITNAGADYFSAVTDTYNYSDLFDAFICLGDRPHLDKSDLLKELLDQFKSKRAAVVGDKASDIGAGRRYDCLTIAALYGYGSNEELSGSHESIGDFPQLLTLFGKGS